MPPSNRGHVSLNFPKMSSFCRKTVNPKSTTHINMPGTVSIATFQGTPNIDTIPKVNRASIPPLITSASEPSLLRLIKFSYLVTRTAKLYRHTGSPRASIYTIKKGVMKPIEVIAARRLHCL
ncbi:hypothetical protein ASA_2002 [Aeromonas salmonicida subsp. salmonicida A449]|uniref:Uncharacterized protein n=1 Tax=Aeromonas salmonicida (strain A449) TaxID=382245 RepID=A4SMF1_AERS4|nr:hypothetical protein ASA_2002 [Aeromonas salmonicida subsp. salmonicida A449]